MRQVYKKKCLQNLDQLLLKIYRVSKSVIIAIFFKIQFSQKFFCIFFLFWNSYGGTTKKFIFSTSKLEERKNVSAYNV